MRKRHVIFVLTGIWIVVLAQAVQAQPAGGTFQDDYNQGQAAYDRGDYQQAAKKFAAAAQLNPNSAQVYNALGLTHSALGSDISDVVWFYNVAIQINPHYAEAYRNKCRALAQASDYDRAIAACEGALKVDPRMTSVRWMLGWIYLQGKPDGAKAVKYFEQVTAVVHKPTAYFGLGMAYAMHGDLGKVMDVITKLRGMGAGDLATKLEAAVRTGPAGPAPEKPPAPKAAVAPSPTAGMPIMRVRLRGKLVNLGPVKPAPPAGSAAAASAPAPAASPSTLSTSSSSEGSTLITNPAPTPSPPAATPSAPPASSSSSSSSGFPSMGDSSSPGTIHLQGTVQVVH